MFGFGKNKTEQSAPPPSQPRDPGTSSKPGSPLISAILMEGDSYPLDDLAARLQRSQLGSNTPKDLKTDKGILMFGLGDEIVAIAPMPAPYPRRDLEGPCATSWMWPKDRPATSVLSHRTHVLVTMLKGQSSPIDRRLVHTQITALAAEQPGALGIYWPEATLVHFPKLFIDGARRMNSPKKPPIMLWVDFRGIKNSDGSLGMFTTGLAPLGLLEIEIPKIKMAAGELREWMMNIVSYLLDKGPVLKHGQTIGVDANNQLRITHVPSQFGKPGIVIRIGD